MAILGILLIVLLVLTIFAALYVYTALALIELAKKTNTEPTYLAWIPVANLYLLSKMAGMPSWPMYLLIGCLIPIINIFASIAIGVFGIIWYWKVFEKIGRPGWWAVIPVIPFFGGIVFLVLLGIAAWGDNQNPVAPGSVPPAIPPSAPVQ